jgi:hypothetical protein
MAVQGSVQDNFTFVGGINTEGGFFVTPPNSWKEGDNVIPRTDGSLERRRGLDFEVGYTTQPVVTDVTSDAYTTHLWNSVNGDGTLDIVVIQVGAVLYFYNALGGTVSARYLGNVNFASLQAAGNTDVVANFPIQTAVVFGDLVVTHKSCDPFVVRYVGGVFSAERIIIQIRDFAGVYMDAAITEEKTEAQWETDGLRAAALYNLANQGWNLAQINAYKAANSSRLPANTKSWIYGKDSNDDFSASVLNKQDFGSSPAPKGRVIFDAFNQIRSVTALSITSTTAPSESWQDQRIYTNNAVGDSALNIYSNFVTTRPRACGFFAGRVWYAGMSNSFQNGWVYFSQVVNSKDKYAKCYQDNDPTSEVFSDLLDNDGGVIVIPEVGEIVALRGTSNAMVVFATNGIWTIVGTDTGFKANSYVVSKVSNVGCISSQSIVEVENAFMFWSFTGVYVIVVGQIGEAQIQNISDQNIKTLYDDITPVEKLTAQGAYDYITKTVEWVYGAIGTNNKALIFDTRLSAWYTFTFADATPAPEILGLFATTQASGTDQNLGVFVGVDEVLVNTDQVVANITTIDEGDGAVKYTTLVGGNALTFSDFNLDTFSDWGVAEMPAYVITGYDMGGVGPARAKTAGYLTAFMKRTEESFDSNTNPTKQSGCLMTTRWDFTDNTFAGKWGQAYQIYRQNRPYLAMPNTPFDDGYPLVITKNKIRGRGKALQIKYEAEVGKDMKLVGWSITFVGNTNV